MERIAIIGCGGGGKSTLARELGEILGIEVFHLDRLHWKPGWVETPKDEWRRVVEDLVKGKSWIIDGNYGGTIDIRLDAADTIIFLDLPRWINLWRILKRRFQYGRRQRPDIGPGCPEKIDWEFFRWVWTFPRERRPSLLHEVERHAAEKQVIVLHTAREVREFVKRVRRSKVMESPA